MSSPSPARLRRHTLLTNAGLTATSLAAIVLAYWSTVDLSLATAAVMAVATAAHMHARLAMGRWMAALLVALSAAALVLAGASERLVVAVVVSSLAGSELISHCTRRSAVVQAGAWTGLLGAAALIADLEWRAQPIGEAASREALLALAGGVLAAPLLQTVGPMLEWIFGHTTRLTMSEWLSLEHPLLQDLWAKAPGTFQHSINVGVLASSAVGAIGGDSLLAHVGGLYHDVGKVRAPGFFIENQQGPNPHDRLPPWESAAILRAHVVDGVALVGAHGMGERIADFVREHHGTGLMRLQREKAEALGRLDDEETYRYPGPRPRSRETAVVMMADQVDATARSAPPEDEAACQAIVDRTLDRIGTEGQLEDSGVSARDLERLRAAFTKALGAMYHRRLTYPPTGTEALPAPRSPLVPRLFTRRGPR